MISTTQHPLRILMTNHQLMDYQGSEIFTFTIADFLKRKGHEITLYCAYIGKLKKDFESIGVKMVTDLKQIKDASFDVAHVHHHINSYEIRYHFPELPIVMLCHGIIFLEHPPALNLNFSHYLATSERVRKSMVSNGVPENKIDIFRNIVDTDKFRPLSPINSSPQQAVIISNKIDVNSENVIREACNALKIKTLFIGQRFKKASYKEIPKILNRGDIVFSLGRGVIEAMLCGRIPIVFDYEGGDGMVTPSTIEQNITCNFSGNLHNTRYSVEELISILKAHRAEDSIHLQAIATDYFGAHKRIDGLIDIYRSAINKKIEPMHPNDKKILSSIVSSIAETRAYSRHHSLSQQPFMSFLRKAKYAVISSLTKQCQ